MKLTKQEKIEKRQAYDATLDTLFKTYHKVLIVKTDNIRSIQITQIRKLLRGQAELVFGKKTLMERYIKNQSNEALKVLLPYIKLNIGLVFTNGEYKPIMKAFEDSKRRAAAKAGVIAPCDVVVEPQLTQMGPDQHGFVAAMGITTKINKGKIEITAPVDLIKKGHTVTASHAALLSKLGIEPFFYKMEVSWVYDNGLIFDSSILEVDDDVMKAKFQEGVDMFTSVALAADIPVLPAVPHIMADALKTIMGVGIECEMNQIPQIAKLIEIMKNPSAFAAPAAAAAAPAAEEKKEEKAPEEEVIGGFNMDSSSSDEE